MSGCHPQAKPRRAARSQRICGSGCSPSLLCITFKRSRTVRFPHAPDPCPCVSVCHGRSPRRHPRVSRIYRALGLGRRGPSGRRSSGPFPIPAASAKTCGASPRVPIMSARHTTRTTRSGCSPSSSPTAWKRRSENFTTLFRDPQVAFARTRRARALQGESGLEPAVSVDPTSNQAAEQLPTYNAYSRDGDDDGAAGLCELRPAGRITKSSTAWGSAV